ncbi:MAG: SprB repeat-containing protein, partial [Bacteroidetes bacterium]|nr:SprB repeat-containing protein [Bacteroidota bacterium]
MNTLSTRLRLPALRVLALSWALCSIGAAQAQRTKYWVGGSGAWSDAAHWSLTVEGRGGAGVPRNNEDVVIAPAAGAIEVRIDQDAFTHGLTVDGGRSEVTIAGARTELRVTGDLRARGAVQWRHAGLIELDLRTGLAELDLRGIPLGGDLVFTGGGTWSMRSDLVLGSDARLAVREGTLVTNGNLLRTGTLAFEGRRAKKLVANTSVVMAERAFEPGDQHGVVDTGTSRLVVNGAPAEWGTAGDPSMEALRAINICGTGPGQTLFTINAQLVSNYNGFGVSCHGVCNGSVHVSVTGGVGPFFYTWIGGPSGTGAATWNNVCPGNQIVIVTDQGQGISCATTVQVTDPALLSVIFFGNTPPSCAGVCDGVSNAFAVGGVPTYNYVWNSGAGTGASFNQLCPGANTLHVTDANLCTFDTTFNFPVFPITPHLTFGNASCAGECNGNASVAPTGGTGSFTYDWLPGTPTGDGTNSVSQLCAGNYSVTITDSHGCDTTVAFTITEPPAIIPNPTQVDATCWNSCDGSATVAPTGPTGPFTFTWAPAPGGGQGTAAATGLCAGTYTCTVRDVPTGCDTVVTFTITAPPPIDPHAASTYALCAGSCDGTAQVAPTGGTPGYTYLWSPAPPAGQGTPSVTGLCAGTWTVLITDLVGCDSLITFTIAEPPPIVPAPAQTDVTCAGRCDGTATVAPTGGTGAFTYAWTPSPPAGQGTPSASQLCAGPWSVLITDANGCDTTVQFTILEPLPLQATPSQTNVTCGGNCDGTASVVVTGGTGTYTYAWTPAPGGGQGTPNATGLCAGPASVLITDANGCTLTRNFTILPAVPMQLSLNIVPASCPGVCDGTAGIIVTGGVPGYTYLWSPAPGAGQGTPNVTALCPQAYTLTVTDAVGCDTTIAFTITAPLPILPNEVVTDATCFGTCDGSIVLAPTGGSGTYTYAWTPVPPNGQGTAQATGLCAGSYQVVITSGACDTTLTLSIVSPTAIVPGLTVTNVACAGECTGTATANTSGGTPGYTYLWAPAPGAGQGTPNATAMCPGNYTLTITDAAGCDTIVPFTVTAPAPIVPNLGFTNADCGAACNGTATVNPTGGTPGYTYLWTPAPGGGQGTSSVTGLCPGNWSVTITDAALCDTTVQFTIITPPPIQVTSVVTPASCADACDGAIALTATGGLPPYTYTWSPTPGAGQGTPNASGLCPGDWIVIIGDQAGCDTTLTFTVGSPTAILPNGSFTDESCNGPCDGTATVAPTGGGGTYAFFWSPAPPNGQGTNSVSGLCSGPWSVTITDGNGCDTTWSFMVSPVVPINAQIDVQDGLCWGECIGEATVTVTGGVGGYTYDWQPAPPAGQGTDHVTGLCMGNYQVTIADAAGCDTTIQFTVFKPQPIEPNLVVEGEDCTGACTGQAAVFPFGGAGGFSYDWQPVPGGGQGTNTATGLCAGVNYQVTVTDANGCDTTVAFTVLPFDPIVPDVTVVPASCATSCDGTATVGATGGEGPYTFFWSPVPPNGQGVATATGLCPGTYDLTITDANDCDTTVQVVITAPPPFDVTPTVQ